MTTIKRLLAIVPLSVSLSACSSDNQKVDLGDDGKPGATAQGLAAYQGTWDGYAEAYHFDQGSDRVRVTLDSAGNGTIRLGDAPEFAPFSDPSIGYPAEVSFTAMNYSSFDYRQPHEGFAYPVLNAGVESGRLHFAFWDTDIVKTWCEAQTSYPDAAIVEAGHYTCNPAGGSFGSDKNGCTNNDGAAADCGFSWTCFAGCRCTAAACSSDRTEGPGFDLKSALDGVLENDTLVGTLVLPGDDGTHPARITIRLTR